MIWHYLPEIPKPDTEVLAEIEDEEQEELGEQFLVGWPFKYVVLKYDYDFEEWRLADHILQRTLCCFSLLVKRWAYIEEE